MAYQTGTALNANDLLDKLRVFAAAQGWTVNAWAVRSDAGGSGGWCLNLQKDDLHVALFADLGAGNADNPGQYLGGYLYPAWSGANGNMDQASKSVNIYGNGLGVSQYVAYHLFAGAEHVHLVVETVTGVFKHFGFGRLRRLGVDTTGAYLFVSSWHYHIAYRGNVFEGRNAIPFDSLTDSNTISFSTLVRADSDGSSPRYLATRSDNVADRLTCGFRDSHDYLPIRQGMPSSLTGRTPLWPIMVAARRFSSSLSSPIGQPPDLRWVRLDYLNPGDVLTLGTDEWMVFPIIRKNGGVGEVNSGVYGLAYRR